MNQSCPHCQALVILPELVCNYGDMPIQCHDCESSVFLPAEQLSKTNCGWFGSAVNPANWSYICQNEPNRGAFAPCLLELHITLASLTFVAFTRLAQ